MKPRQFVLPSSYLSETSKNGLVLSVFKQGASAHAREETSAHQSLMWAAATLVVALVE